uniref:WASH complex subunit 3 n=1 Tax=Takifugu rubripes TaxID=31033 RepID=A0A674MXH3_TAKRU
MDEDGLPLMGSGVDLHMVPAIQQRRIVAFFNQFVVHTVRFVNRFAIVCEEVRACLFSFVYLLHLQLQLTHLFFFPAETCQHISAHTAD